VPGAETSLQFGLSAMVVDEEDFAMSMLITVVAIESLLRRLLMNFLDVWAGHRDGNRFQGET